MSYKDQLEKLDHIYESEERADEIARDIHDVLNDGSVFGELIASSVGEALARTIEKSGLDGFVNQGVDEMKSVVAEAVHNAMGSDEFTHEFADLMARKEIDREMQQTPEAGHIERD